MVVSVANGPVSWGVYYGGDPTNFPWPKYLDEVSAAGFRWTELGPIGYLPEDPVQLRDELAKRQLRLVAGFIFKSLHDPAERPNLKTITHRTCRLLSALEAKHYVLIDNLPAERAKTAGRSEAAPRLAPEAWRAFMMTLRELAAIARDEYGLSPVIHPHVGGYLEFADEIDAALFDLPEDLVGLCIDTGHSAYAGVDPIALLRQAAGRVRYLHFKNIHPARHRRALERQLDLFAAISEGVFCPLADGVVDFVAFRQALDAQGYGGHATIEQDSDPRAGALPAKDAVASLTFLECIGVAESRSTLSVDQI